MKITNKQFEDFLKEQHDEQYTGPSDMVEEAFENWIENMDIDDMINYGDEFGQQQYEAGLLDGEK